jgi:NADPH-dependent 2,4-dienoyl-CoA reductase/sulfur reductase-like enzyme
MVINKDVIIVGGGPAGLAAAARLKELGIRDILILEREKLPGGILRQCIHDGFGLTRFREALSGPEYAARFIAKVEELGIGYLTDSTVLEITPEKRIIAVSKDGLQEYQAKAVILTTGCRERTRGAISIPGTRPAGIYTAGVAQAYVNLKNIMVGKKIVILGSGDIGLIMARRMTLEGARVLAVFEILPYASGLPRISSNASMTTIFPSSSAIP